MKAANYILDLVRTYGRQGTTARNIMESAQFFSFSENLIRVTLSRLSSRGLIENVERGRYRLTRHSDPINDFVEEWRLGEARRKRWQSNRFNLVHLQKVDTRSSWVLDATGFRSFRDDLWARPDNLARPLDDLIAWLTQMGLSKEALLITGAYLDDTSSKLALAQFDLKSMERDYRQMTQKLNRSTEKLPLLPRSKAMKESFTLGGAAIQLLAKDPLLPTEVLDPALRIELTRTVLYYDQLGRSIWADQPVTMPAERASYA